jgi:hypothetical protein
VRRARRAILVEAAALVSAQRPGRRCAIPEGGTLNNKTVWVMAGVLAMLTGALGASRASGALAPASHADEARTMARSIHILRYVHLYSDARGVSHFRNERLTFRSSAASPAASRGLSAPEALLSYSLSNARGATLLLLKPGAREDWHRAPRRMWLIVVQGAAQVTAGDGEVRRFGVGSVLLMDDTTGKGHITRTLGKVDHIALTIPAPAG